jgi:hypothetical protein
VEIYNPSRTFSTVKSALDEMVTYDQLKSELKKYTEPSVVQCRECLHHGGKNSDDECALITKLLNLQNTWLRTQPFDFCSSGERRTE